MDYRRILAVTFTNKAADEMKGRVLGELDILDRKPAESMHLEYLKEYFKTSDLWVQKTAGLIKSLMLHDYTRISVGTIDSFFQQILRAFARESGLSSTFQLELDTDLVLEKFSRFVFSEATGNDQLMGWLVEWVNERMENQETWHKLEADLTRLGSELLREDILALFLSDASAIPAADDILQLRNTCRRIIKDFNDSKSRIAAQAAAILQESHLSVDDFSYGTGGPAGTLVKLADSREGPKPRARDSIGNPDKWVARKSPLRLEITNNIYPRLNPLMEEAVRLFDEEIFLYNSARSVNRNLYALGFASFLFDYFKAYFNDNDQLIMSLAQPLVNQIVGDNPSPFIYEKTGTFYKHFLIDEFQDTSDLQWRNFQPLIVDSLAEDGLSMIVGDIKQSLYRWRNSNWRLLHRKAVDDMKAFQSDFYPLSMNQRSRYSIVHFNNRIFEALPGLVVQNSDFPVTGGDPASGTDPDIIRQVFQGSEQDDGRKADQEGRVEIRFYDKSDKGADWKEKLERELPLIVEDLLVNQGYQQEDITFLVRKNSDADKITRILSQSGNNWTFVSSDVFRIGNSPVIKIILNAMRYLADPGQTLYRDLFLWECYQRSHDGLSPVPGFQDAAQEHFQSFMDSVMHNDLLTVTDNLIRDYELDRNEDDLAYLFQFRDQVKGCMNRGISHINGFLAWWDAAGHKQMLVAESLGSSMRIMTIHKSKGLSSPVIIIPYCNWEFNHSGRHAPWLWVPTAGTPFDQVGLIPVRYDSSLGQSHFATGYLKEKIEAHLDNINLLYVAFTRAIDVLVAFCPYGGGFKTVADALYGCLKDDLTADGIYYAGDRNYRNQAGTRAEPEEIHLTTPMVTGNLKATVSHRSEDDFKSTRFGKNVHEILETVETREELAESLAAAVRTGHFTFEEASSIEQKMDGLFTIPSMADWFSGKWETLNETGILIPRLGEKRPDRVMLQGDRVVVMDYKTGAREKKHEKQVGEYMLLLTQMGYPNVEGYLLYLDTEELVEVKAPATFFQPDLFDQEV